MKKTYPLITVILTTYNRAHLLRNAIKSVIENSYKNFELVIIDDASTDNTKEVVAEIDEKRIVYFKMPVNSGVLAARNKGFDLAKGEYIVTLDDDDELMSHALETVVFEFQRKSPHGFKILWFDCIDAETGFRSGRPALKEGPVRYEDYVCGRFQGDFWIALEHEVLQGKRFDERLWGYESLLWLQLHKQSKAYYVPRVVCKKFRMHGERMCDIENQISHIPQITLAHDEFMQKFGEDVRRLCPKLYGSKKAYLGMHRLLIGDFPGGRKEILESMRYRFSVKYLGLFLLSFCLTQTQLLRLYEKWTSKGLQSR